MMAIGAGRILGALSRPSLLVVNYHRLHRSSDRLRSRFDDGVFGPDVETFRRQVEWLKSATTVLDEEGVLSLLSGKDLPRGSLLSAITFDDGYIDCYTLARSVLESWAYADCSSYLWKCWSPDDSDGGTVPRTS